MKSSKQLSESWQLGWAPKYRGSIPDWAREHVILSPPITKTGYFDVSQSRHFVDIFASCQNDHKRETNVLKPVRGGGSLIGDIRAPFVFVNDPGPYMDIFQTDKVADEHAESRIIPTFENCKPLAALFPSVRHKKRNNEIMFTNGCAWYCCGPSIGNLQTKGIRWMRLEEVWMWDQGRMGDALARLGDYLRDQISHALTISQGGPKDGSMHDSDWYRHFHRGQLFEWETVCLGCGKYFDPVFSGTREDGTFWGVTWDKHKLPNGDWNISKCLPTVRFECPHCGHPSIDNGRTKSEWNRAGRWSLRSEPNAKRDSFRWEAVIDYPWDDLVSLWLEASNAFSRGDLGPKIQFYQKRRAMFMDEESLLRGGINLRKTAYEINSDWPEEKARFLSVDRQEEDLFWWSVRAWSSEKSRRLGFGKCYGFAAVEEIRLKFKVPPNRTFMDSGFLPKGDHGVYAACLKYGWVAAKGAQESNFIHTLKNKRKVLKSYAPMTYADPGSGTANQGRRYCWLQRFSKSLMNSKVQELIDHGHWEEPITGEDPEMEKEYAAQMSARVKKTEYSAKTGESKVFWKEAKNDHARDLANMQVMGAIICELLPDPASERLTPTEQKEQEATA